MRNYKCYLVLILSQFTNAHAKNISTNEYYVPHQGQQLHLKQKKSVTGPAAKVVVLVNPLSIPTLKAFDVPGYSLMDALAAQGFDVWGLDFTGQGTSSYPAVMQKTPSPTGIFPLDAQQAVTELDTAIRFISQQTGKQSVSIIGWSWGAVVGAMYSIAHPKRVDHLVLYGAMYASRLSKSMEPLFIKPYASATNTFNQALPAYHNIPWRFIDSHWKMMIKGNTSIVDQQAVEAVRKVYLSADPNPVTSGSLRRPLGPMKDLYSIWTGKPVYPIEQLTTPTLVIYGTQDTFADPKLYAQLKAVKRKKEIKLRRATHWLIYEKSRTEFVDSVVSFLQD